jgi:hypothetical protein
MFAYISGSPARRSKRLTRLALLPLCLSIKFSGMGGIMKVGNNLFLGPRLAFLVAVIFLTVWDNGAHASILTFDEARRSGVVVPTVSGSRVPQDYGDRVTGVSQAVPGGHFTYGEAGEGFTPNVLVDYFAGSTAGPDGVSLWEDSYGDLVNVLFGNQNSITLNVRLTADAGVQVLLYHFDLAGWPNADYAISGVRVFDDDAILYSQNNVLVEGNLAGLRRTSFDFPNPLSGRELLIEIDYSNLPGSQQDNLGLDNIRFGQFPAAQISEPASGLLLGLGLVALVHFRRQTLRRS